LDNANGYGYCYLTCPANLIIRG